MLFATNTLPMHLITSYLSDINFQLTYKKPFIGYIVKHVLNAYDRSILWSYNKNMTAYN